MCILSRYNGGYVGLRESASAKYPEVAINNPFPGGGEREPVLVSFFGDSNAPDLSLQVTTKAMEENHLPGKGVGASCERGYKRETKCIQVAKRGSPKQSHSMLVFQGDGTAPQNKNKDRESFEKVNEFNGTFISLAGI